MMVVLFSMGVLVGFMKLFSSKNMMTSLISMEVVMANILMMMMISSDVTFQGNILLFAVCLVVCEGSIGLSILSSIYKIQANEFLFKACSSVK